MPGYVSEQTRLGCKGRLWDSSVVFGFYPPADHFNNIGSRLFIEFAAPRKMVVSFEASATACRRGMLGSKDRVPIPRSLLSVSIGMRGCESSADEIIGMATDRVHAPRLQIPPLNFSKVKVRPERLCSDPSQSPLNLIKFHDLHTLAIATDVGASD